MNYGRLANEIILQAVKDYRSYRKVLAREPDNALVKGHMEECEEFFLSDWFKVLTNVDGTFILKKIQFDVKNVLNIRIKRNIM